MFDQTRTVGARVTGPSHAAQGTGCDDAFSWRQFGDSVQVLAVADGAGSVSGTSAWGSWAATQFVIQEDVALPLITDLAKAASDDEVRKILKILFLGALQFVSYHGSRMGIPLRLMDTTLIVAIVTPARTWVAEIGDGIVAVPEGDKAKTILVEEKGDGPANETCFLQLLGKNPDHPAFRYATLDATTAIALSTDGLRYPLTRTTLNYAAAPGVFEALWKNARSWTPEQVEKFLLSIPTTVKDDPPQDDKTLLLAIRPTAQPNTDWLTDLIPGVSTSGGSPMPPAPPRQREPEPVEDTRLRREPASLLVRPSRLSGVDERSEEHIPAQTPQPTSAGPVFASQSAYEQQSPVGTVGPYGAESSVPLGSPSRLSADGTHSPQGVGSQASSNGPDDAGRQESPQSSARNPWQRVSDWISDWVPGWILGDDETSVPSQPDSMPGPPSQQPIVPVGQMRQCPREPTHQYPAELASCPRCASVDGWRFVEPEASQRDTGPAQGRGANGGQ